MYTNAKIIIYLLKVDNENPGTKFVICLKLTKKRHRNNLIDNEDIKKH